MFTIDGVTYNKVAVVHGSLKRSFEIREGPGSLKFLDGDEDPDIIGTYDNYELEVDSSRSDPAQYDQLYEVLSAPVKYHTVTLPYGQSTITFEARVTSGGDNLQENIIGRRKWGGLSIRFKAKKPRRVPSGS